MICALIWGKKIGLHIEGRITRLKRLEGSLELIHLNFKNNADCAPLTSTSVIKTIGS